MQTKAKMQEGFTIHSPAIRAMRGIKERTLQKITSINPAPKLCCLHLFMGTNIYIWVLQFYFKVEGWVHITTNRRYDRNLALTPASLKSPTESEWALRPTTNTLHWGSNPRWPIRFLLSWFYL
ncbi:hypothetical protein XENTR_v10020267 [Xenopus tropicalis]|nr:hypothetical protein XENTR_v10020267 [Xenopus tropicalis]